MKALKANRPRFTSQSQSTYRDPGGFGGNIGKRVMQTQDGAAPRAQDDQTYEFGIHIRQPQMDRDEMKAHIEGKHYTQDMPISIYSQRLNDGSVKKSGSTSIGNPFARNCAFTNDITDSGLRHAEGADGPDYNPAGTGAVLVEAAGGMLSVRLVITRVLKELADCSGGNGVKALSQLFYKYDSSGDQKLDREELRMGLGHMGIKLGPTDLDQIFAHFDHDRSGAISLSEFIRGCRGGMNARRKTIVEQAFRALDKTGDGRVTVADLRDGYDASKHPKVVNGEMTQDKALGQFMSQWKRNATTPGGLVRKTEFVDYYRDVSAAVEKDDYFELMIRNSWNVSGGGNTTCRRVQVTTRNGKQFTAEIQNDLGLIGPNDFDKMRVNLHRQNIHGVIKIENPDGSKKEWTIGK